MSQELDVDAVTGALKALGRLPPDRPFATDALTLTLFPREEGLQEKQVPVEQIASKIVAMRNKLRVMEQRVNASTLGNDEKLRLQAQITRTYDAFTSLVAFFSDDALPAPAEEPAS